MIRLAGLICLLTWCQQHWAQELKHTESGIYYEIFGDQQGIKPGPGDFVKMHLRNYTLQDSLIFDSSMGGDDYIEYQLNRDSTNTGDVQEAISLLTAGDSGCFFIPVKNVYSENFIPSFAKKDSSLKYLIRIREVMPLDQYLKQEKESREKQAIKDSLLIVKKIASIENGMNVEYLEGGLVRIIHKVGQGEPKKKGDSVMVHYQGRLLNGKMFDDSYKRNEAFNFILGAGQVIKGWEKGLAGLTPGTGLTLFIPSAFAYGKHGAGKDIPPNALLVFDIELLK